MEYNGLIFGNTNSVLADTIVQTRRLHFALNA